MKSQKLKNWMILGSLLTPLLASAQTAEKPAISAEVKMTVDYLGSILDTMSDATQASRFDVDPEYSKSGRELQDRLRIKIEKFRSSLVTLSASDFGENLKLYRKAAEENNLSSAAAQKGQTNLFQTLQDQSQNISQSFQNEIKRLISIEPSWVPKTIKLNSKKQLGKNPKKAFVLIFLNGDEQPLNFEFDEKLINDLSESLDNDERFSNRVINGYTRFPNIWFEMDKGGVFFEGSNRLLGGGRSDVIRYPSDYLNTLSYAPIETAIAAQIKKTLTRACHASTTCQSNLYADYTNYLHQVRRMINQPISLKLDISNEILIHELPLEDADAETRPYREVYRAIENFHFNPEENTSF